jgi:endonuclease V-like protein UPF0215 family
VKIIKIRNVKREIRILGVDDGKIIPRKLKKSFIVGVVCRGGDGLEGVLKTKIEVDGFDATSRIIKMIKTSNHYNQIRVLMLNGLNFAGYNLVDVEKLFEKTKKPVIVINKNKTDVEQIGANLKNLNNWQYRIEMLKKAGEPIPVEISGWNRFLYIQVFGIEVEDAKKIVKISSTFSDFPEPLRLANIVASALQSSFLNEEN